MNIHNNARTTPHGRGEVARQVLAGLAEWPGPEAHRALKPERKTGHPGKEIEDADPRGGGGRNCPRFGLQIGQ